MNARESEDWLRRAEGNLRLAQQGKMESIFLEDLCFQAQQAAEKALKGLLIYLTGEFPKVHSLGLLLERLEAVVAVPDSIKETVDLSDYAVQTRYPGDYDPVSDEEYQRALELATRAVQWVKGELQQRRLTHKPDVSE